MSRYFEIVSSPRAHSSAIRFSAARLTSKERLKRANASSYDIFFITVLFTHWFLATKVRCFAETTKLFPEN